jgi:predicted Zn-dependent protease
MPVRSVDTALDADGCMINNHHSPEKAPLMRYGMGTHPVTSFRLVMAVGICIMSVLFGSCSTVPLTGRQHLSLIPGSEMLSMSGKEYGDFLKKNKVIPAADRQAMIVRTVGGRIQSAVEQYFRQNNLSLSGYSWEFNLVENKEKNAWCMPGGKVVVYTGILPLTTNDVGLAVVLGHEIAHAVAGHGDERMSQAMLAQLGGAALSQALSEKPEQTRQIWMSVFGVGVQYGALLPFSRVQESEADHLGLIFMAMAGYDPNEALGFWQRMAQQSQGQAPPELMSTHPSDESRIAKIREELPEAMQYYKRPK